MGKAEKVFQFLKNLPAHTMNLPGNVNKLKNKMTFNRYFTARGTNVAHRNIVGSLKNIGKGMILPGAALGAGYAGKKMMEGNE